MTRRTLRPTAGLTRGVALLACAVAILLGTSTAAIAAPAKKQCKVPNVVGKKEAAAKKALTKANCAVGAITKKSSPKVAKGKVIASAPKKGTKHKAGTKVKLTVSSGKAAVKKQCKVPDLVGKTEAKAKKALTKANCAVGAITKKSSSSVAKGKVISSSPKKGTTHPAGTKVALVLSTGKATPAKQCKVPAVVGKPEAAAKTAITKANCAVGTVTQKSSSSVAKGKVISSSPKKGTTHPAGSKVDLVVSSGKTTPPKQCKVPAVVGKTQAAAEAAIKKANCSVGTVKQQSSQTVAKGKVISSSPAGGTTHPAGTKVDLVVSTGKGSTYSPPKPATDATADLRRI